MTDGRLVSIDGHHSPHFKLSDTVNERNEAFDRVFYGSLVRRNYGCYGALLLLLSILVSALVSSLNASLCWRYWHIMSVHRRQSQIRSSDIPFGPENGLYREQKRSQRAKSGLQTGHAMRTRRKRREKIPTLIISHQPHHDKYHLAR